MVEDPLSPQFSGQDASLFSLLDNLQLKPSHARLDDVADGAGYVDFGQEDWDDEAYSGDEADPNKRAKTAGPKTSGVFNNLQLKPKKKATDRVSNMFLGGRGRDGTIGPSGSKVRPPN